MDALVSDRLVWNGESCAANWGWCREVTGRTLGELADLEGMISRTIMQVDREDYWVWKLGGSGKFSTKILDNLIMNLRSPSINACIPTQRNILVPKKVGVFVWRARRKRLSVLSELDKRGIDLHSVLCPLCNNEVETVEHALFSCPLVRGIWDKIYSWWGLGSSHLCFNSITSGDDNVQCSMMGAEFWQATIWASTYLIWQNRNKMVFKKSGWSSPSALCEIQVKSFEWIGKRCKLKSELVGIDWLVWLHNPNSLLCM
ncbi:uncharacterized protein [Rutidosis leptorrhynchoides]|uniref:uncharacterized protein n=1 Tax=Rutidosis leptorrhynchoides TaxID=125765 RepID=UPI003A9A668B